MKLIYKDQGMVHIISRQLKRLGGVCEVKIHINNTDPRVEIKNSNLSTIHTLYFTKSEFIGYRNVIITLNLKSHSGELRQLLQDCELGYQAMNSRNYRTSDGHEYYVDSIYITDKKGLEYQINKMTPNGFNATRCICFLD